MSNQKSWDREYQNSKLVTKDQKPQKDFLRFLKWLKKDQKVELDSDYTVLDLGCGTGRNSFYLAEKYGVRAIGWDFSETAIAEGQKNFNHPNLTLEKRDVSDRFPLGDNSIDLVLDITTSNALNESQREIYLKEVSRVLKPGGYFYVRALALEGDKNAKELLDRFPGIEKDTYIHPELGVIERVFSEGSFRELYEPYFKIFLMKKKTGYQKFGNQSYKRNYWNVYLRKVVS
jgi:ubiquinone/menaquinone biosynthesis C-methylase UbiE